MASYEELASAELANQMPPIPADIPRIRVSPYDAPPVVDDPQMGSTVAPPTLPPWQGGRLFEPDQSPAPRRMPEGMISELPAGAEYRYVEPEPSYPPMQGRAPLEPDQSPGPSVWQPPRTPMQDLRALGGAVQRGVDFFRKGPAPENRQRFERPYTAPQTAVQGAGHVMGALVDPARRLVESQQTRFDPRADPLTQEQARQEGPGAAAEVTMNVAGLNTPFMAARPGVGVFGARGGKHYKPEMEELAVAMEKNGAPPSEIWKQTGTMRGKDNIWIQEIPDISSRFIGDRETLAKRLFARHFPDKDWSKISPQNRATLRTQLDKIMEGHPKFPIYLEDILDHPELFKAYPELRKMPVSKTAMDEYLGAYLARSPQTPKGKIEYSIQGPASMMRRGQSLNTVLHEVQHAIANIEGMAKGASGSTNWLPGSLAEKLYLEQLKNTPKVKSLDEFKAFAGDSADIDIRYNEYKRLAELKRRDFMQNAREIAASESYRLSAGEGLAKLPPLRKDMTPDQLAAIYPGSQMYPRMEQQLVEYNAPFNAARQEVQASRATGLQGPRSPATGSFNPLENVDVSWKGQPMAKWTPQDWKEVGDHYGVKNLGPLSPPQRIMTPEGYQFDIPGGLSGTWTYYDLLHMKANPINPNYIPYQIHTEMQKKLGRTMSTAGNPSQEQIWNGLVFGMTSQNNPLFPNQMSASRLKMRGGDTTMINKLADSVPWEPGAKVTRDGQPITKEMRSEYDRAIGRMFGIHAGPEGGLGTRGSINYTYVAEMAQMFRKNPEWFRKKPDEQWSEFVERLATQTKGLSMKTGSFGSVWQDPFEAAISAIDRHMVKEFDKRGGLFKDAAEQQAWQEKTLKAWNKDLPAEQHVKDWKDLTKQSGFDGFLGEKLLDYVGSHEEPLLRVKKTGGYNPDVPKHLQDPPWLHEPEKVVKVGQAYQRALAANQKAANEQGINLFMSQWLEWDRIRQRFEPHENMFPGLQNLPAPSRSQLQIPLDAHTEAGFKNYEKGPTGQLHPTKRSSRNPSEFGYLGIAGAAGAGATMGGLVDPGGYRRDY